MQRLTGRRLRPLDQASRQLQLLPQSTFLASHLAIILLMIEARQMENSVQHRIFISAAREWPRRVAFSRAISAEIARSPATGLAEACPSSGAGNDNTSVDLSFPGSASSGSEVPDCWSPKHSRCQANARPASPAVENVRALRGSVRRFSFERITNFSLRGFYSPEASRGLPLKSGDGEFLTSLFRNPPPEPSALFPPDSSNICCSAICVLCSS